MGITGELVRSVFSKTRSTGSYDSNVKNSAMEKKKWTSVRSYLCGDEFNSVLAEEDSASIKSSAATITQTTEEISEATITQTIQESSEATVTQPIVLEDLNDKEDFKSKETKEEIKEEKLNSTARLFREDDAASAIQSAFRHFLARREYEEIKLMEDGKQGSPSRESVGTSIEVQTGNSVEVLSIREESLALPYPMHKRTRSQVLKLKEDWDDSTVSSNISKMRIQNRLEATTRRERALAYAFSQQLRICSKKKQTEEPNVGWSWLERWMATRLPEASSIENGITKQLDQPINNINQSSVVRKRLFDVAVEEKESCGSNEVSFQFDSISVSAQEENIGARPVKNRLKATRVVSKRKTAPSYHYSKEHTKVCKKECAREEERERKHKLKQSGSKRESKCEDTTAQLSPDTVITNNSKLSVLNQ